MGTSGSGRWWLYAAALAAVWCSAPRAGARPAARGSAPAFAIRGIKGLWWEGIESYRKALPWLARHRMNFLMYCYSSFPASGQRWREDYTPSELAAFRDMAADARGLGVRLCLSFNPGIWSRPPLVYSDERDYQLALRKVRMVHATGVHWFALCLDDIGRELSASDRERFGTLAAAQAHFVNRLWRDMATLRPKPVLIFCPSAYTTADARAHMDYIRTVGGRIDPAVRFFWTGPEVCSPSITAADARAFVAWIRRKPIVWDNYPVNDMFPWRPLLAPLRRRSPDLGAEVAGYMANPMRQWELSRIPLATTARYLAAPAAYDPARAGRAALEQFAPADRPAVAALAALYGTSFWGEPGFPPRPTRCAPPEARSRLARYQAARALLRARPALRDLYAAAEATLDEDIREFERMARPRRERSPLAADGDEFEGGGGPVFGFSKLGRRVNYVYARPTGRDRIEVAFWPRRVPAAGARLLITARNDDFGTRARIVVSINDWTVFAGPSPFPSEGFATRGYRVPAEALRSGRNLLTIRNLEREGVLGMPPWFMVSEARLAIGRGVSLPERAAPRRRP